MDDWKNVIWSDKTNIMLNTRRGKVRVWRRANETFVTTCVRRRWSKYLEFMFWGCFTYDRKGLCYIWEPETAAEKKEYTRNLEILNARLEPEKKAEWELTTGIRRMGLRNLGGQKPQWRWNANTGKVRASKPFHLHRATADAI